MKTKGAARERTGAVGPSSWHTTLAHATPPGDRCKREKNVREKGGTYLKTWWSPMTRPNYQCLGRTHSPQRSLQTSHTRHKATQNTPHQQKNEARSEFKKGLPTDSQGEVSKASEDQRRAARERTAAVGCRRGTRPLHTQIPSGIDARGKRTCERREALTVRHGGHR